MEMRWKFNEDVNNYDKWRPTYDPELFSEIILYSELNSEKYALEIGIGTGQATLPILQTKCNLTAIELGPKLTEYTKHKFSSFNNFSIQNIDFESFNCNTSTFDLVYSATAFHWIAQDVGYLKVFDLLKSGGKIALFWNHPFVNRDNDDLHIKIQKIYKELRVTDDEAVEFDINECSCKITALKNTGFVNIHSKLFYQIREFSSNDYISLLNTYSDHRSLDSNVKCKLENRIKLAIEENGNKLLVYDTMDLYLAQKP